MQYFLWYCLLKFVDFIHIWLNWVTENRPLPQRPTTIATFIPSMTEKFLSNVFQGKWTVRLCFTLFHKFCRFQDSFICRLYNGAFSVWDVMWHRLVVGYWCFGIIGLSHLHCDAVQGELLDQPTPHKIPEEWRPPPCHVGSLVFQRLFYVVSCYGFRTIGLILPLLCSPIFFCVVYQRGNKNLAIAKWK
jgi:hypothetical protein